MSRYKRLAAAIIIQALRDAFSISRNAAEEHQREARAWMSSGDTEPGSFQWCCNVLEMEPAEIREMMWRNPAKVCYWLQAKKRGPRVQA